jgi:hypothetical protein
MAGPGTFGAQVLYQRYSRAKQQVDACLGKRSPRLTCSREDVHVSRLSGSIRYSFPVKAGPIRSIHPVQAPERGEIALYSVPQRFLRFSRSHAWNYNQDSRPLGQCMACRRLSCLVEHSFVAGMVRRANGKCGKVKERYLCPRFI